MEPSDTYRALQTKDTSNIKITQCHKLPKTFVVQIQVYPDNLLDRK